MFSLFGFCHCQQHGAYLLLHLFPCKSPWMLCSRNRRSQVSWWHSSFKNFHFSIKMSPLQVRGVKFESSPCPAYCCPVKTQVSFNSSQFPGNNGKRLFQRYRLRIFSIFLSKRFALKTLICLPQWFRYFCLSINVRILHFLIAQHGDDWTNLRFSIGLISWFFLGQKVPKVFLRILSADDQTFPASGVRNITDNELEISLPKFTGEKGSITRVGHNKTYSLCGSGRKVPVHSLRRMLSVQTSRWNPHNGSIPRCAGNCHSIVTGWLARWTWACKPHVTCAENSRRSW